MSLECRFCERDLRGEHDEDCPRHSLNVIKELRQRIAELEAELATAKQTINLMKSQDNAAIETEKRDATKALHALAAVHYPTPLETYGFNSSWAISDLCRCVKEQHERIADLKGSLNDATKRHESTFEQQMRLIHEVNEARERLLNLEAYTEGWGEKFDAFCDTMRRNTVEEIAQWIEAIIYPMDKKTPVQWASIIRKKFGKFGGR